MISMRTAVQAIQGCPHDSSCTCRAWQWKAMGLESAVAPHQNSPQLRITQPAITACNVCVCVDVVVLLDATNPLVDSYRIDTAAAH